MAEIAIIFNPSLEELNKRFSRINIKSFLRVALTTASLSVERESKKVTPVRTGRLRASIMTSAQSAYIGALTGGWSMVKPHVNYAYYVHEGKGTNARKGRRPFMEIGARNAEPKLERQLGFAFKKFIDTEVQNAFKAMYIVGTAAGGK